MTDYIIPMVFDGDTRWQTDYLRRLCSLYERDRHKGIWRSMGNEELLVRCIRTFMPFVGTVVIVLSRESQWQAWMRQEGVRVVYHRDFIPSGELPCFNVGTIEAHLRDIPGLSDTFIFSDRFTFPVSPVEYAESLAETALSPGDDIAQVIGGAEGFVDVKGVMRGETFDINAATVSAAIERRLNNYLEKTNGKGTESDSTGHAGADASAVHDEQRRGGSDHTAHEEKIQDTVAEKRPARKTNPPALAKAGHGKLKKDHRK